MTNMTKGQTGKGTNGKRRTGMQGIKSKAKKLVSSVREFIAVGGNAVDVEGRSSSSLKVKWQDRLAGTVHFIDDDGKVMLALNIVRIGDVVKAEVAADKMPDRGVKMMIHNYAGVVADDAELEHREKANPDDFMSFSIQTRTIHKETATVLRMPKTEPAKHWPSSDHEVKILRAKKDRTCEINGEKVANGDRYAMCVSPSGPYVRMCLRCHRVWQAQVEEARKSKAKPAPEKPEAKPVVDKAKRTSLVMVKRPKGWTAGQKSKNRR